MVLRDAGFRVADHVKVDVHEDAEDTMHIMLPGVSLAKAPRKAANKEVLPLAAYEARQAGKTVVTDGDLQSGNPVAILNDDIHDPDWSGDPTAADAKTDRLDGTDGTMGDRDSDPKPADVADTGKD